MKDMQPQRHVQSCMYVMLYGHVGGCTALHSCYRIRFVFPLEMLMAQATIPISA